MLDILIEFENTRFMTMEELTNYQVKMTVLVSNLNTLTLITKHLIYTYT